MAKKLSRLISALLLITLFGNWGLHWFLTPANVYGSSVPDSFTTSISNRIPQFFQGPLAEAPNPTGLVTIGTARRQEVPRQETAPVEQKSTRLSIQSYSPPGSADLQETVEVKFTQDINDLATSLNNDPSQIYDYVHNEFRYDPYFGSVRGAQETLLERAGNDYDLASLTIALLRTSNIPARYITGTVRIPTAQGINMVRVNDEFTTATIYNSAGVLNTWWTTGFDLDMTWVAAYVNGAWVDIVPWYKQHTLHQGIDVSQVSGIDSNSLASAAQSGANVNGSESWYANLNGQNLHSQLAAGGSQLDEAVRDSFSPGTPVQEVLGTPEIQRRSNIPFTLPFTAQSGLQEYSDLPDSVRYKIRFELTSIDLTFNAPELAGTQITLGYHAATPQDQAVIDSNGSLYDTPPNLVQVEPTLLLDGAPGATGLATTLGATQTLRVHFIDPVNGSDVVNRFVTAGSYYALSLNLGRVSPRLVQRHLNQLTAAQTSMESGQSVKRDAVLGKLLYVQALSYWMQVDFQRELAAVSQDIVWIRYPSIGFHEANLQTRLSGGASTDVERGGTILDVKRSQVNAFAVDGNANREAGWVAGAGAMSSAWEHFLFETVERAPALSTVKVLQEANRQGVRIYYITSNNVASVLPNLSQSQSVKNSVLAAVNSGRSVTIPQQEISYHGWTGTGWLALHESTGYSRWLLSGHTSGGATGQSVAESQFALASILLDTSNNIYNFNPDKTYDLASAPLADLAGKLADSIDLLKYNLALGTAYENALLDGDATTIGDLVSRTGAKMAAAIAGLAAGANAGAEIAAGCPSGNGCVLLGALTAQASQYSSPQVLEEPWEPAWGWIGQSWQSARSQSSDVQDWLHGY